MSTNKSLPIREVKAESIGKLVTVRGKLNFFYYFSNVYHILITII